MLRKLFKAVKYSLLALGFVTFSVTLLLLSVPDVKYKIYKALPPNLRWEISYALSDKFLIGLVYFVEKDDQILLVKHSYQDKWGLPGGWLNKRETLQQSAARELQEELGAGLSDFEILTIRKVPNAQIIDVAVRGRISGDAVKTTDAEIESFRFFPRDALPEDIIRTHKPFVKEYLARQRNSQAPQTIPVAASLPAQGAE